jgi:hypothetical protein
MEFLKVELTELQMVLKMVEYLALSKVEKSIDL